MLLQVAAAQFAGRNCRSVTYVMLDRRVRTRGRANREERVVEQKQPKHETNRPPRKADTSVSVLLGDKTHSLHFIIDAANTGFASLVRLLLNKHQSNERVAAKSDNLSHTDPIKSYGFDFT